MNIVEKQQTLWQKLLILSVNNIIDSIEIPNFYQKAKV